MQTDAIKKQIEAQEQNSYRDSQYRSDPVLPNTPQEWDEYHKRAEERRLDAIRNLAIYASFWIFVLLLIFG
jgi:hypothetical protein